MPVSVKIVKNAGGSEVASKHVGQLSGIMFFRESEQTRIDVFMREGYLIAPVESPASLERIRATVVTEAASSLRIPPPSDHSTFLEQIGDRVGPDRLNTLRLDVIRALTNHDWFREAYFSCGRRILEVLIGNELAMQRSIGLSIQLPHDDSSLLPLHSDAWSEDSPFELVLWVPLVDVCATMSMFVLPRAATVRWQEHIHEYSEKGVEALYCEVEPELHWLEVPFGSAIAFTHTLLHGNRVNREKRARWSINVRFKGLFTPYSEKRLGEFFEPITLRPASRIGLGYTLPRGFHE